MPEIVRTAAGVRKMDDFSIKQLPNDKYEVDVQTDKANTLNISGSTIKKGSTLTFNSKSELRKFFEHMEREGLTFDGKEQIQSLEELLKNASLPDVADLAGAVLERLVKSREDNHIGNFASSVTGTTPNSSPRTPSVALIYEAFQWLNLHGLIAPTQQEGWYFVTQKGKSIGTAAKLKDDLELEQLLKGTPSPKQTQETITELKKQAETQIKKAIEDSQQEAKSVIEGAKNESDKILSLARKTAEGISLSDIQTQFGKAAQKCRTGIWIWAGLSLIFVAAFLITLIGFMGRWAPQIQSFQDGIAKGRDITSAYMIYLTVLRITLLTALAAATTFCLKILRAQLHLREQNLHRQRVANSIAAAMGAASSEQRDVVLERMIDAITAFGNSGLLSENDESMSPAKVVFESISRAFPQK